jgi:hypothetical protein
MADFSSHPPDASAAIVAPLASRLMIGPHDIPATAPLVVLIDPQGATFALFARA